MAGGNVLSIPCPTSTGGGAAGACLDVEIVCFDAGPSPLALYTLWDCDPSSATVGDLISSDYRDPNNPSVVVVPTGVVSACASDLIVQAGIMCDDNGWFNRLFVLSAVGVVGAPIDFDLAGAAYAPVGAVRRCEVDSQDHILLDQGVAFIRRVTVTDGVATFTDFELDGVTLHATAGPVTAPEFSSVVLCDVDAGTGNVTSFVQTFGADGAILARFDMSGGVYVPTGVVGNCESRVVEQEILCDFDVATNNRIAEFVRRWVVSADDNSVSVGPLDFTLDGVTPYVPVGVVGECSGHEAVVVYDARVLHGTGFAVLNPVSIPPIRSFTVTVSRNRAQVVLQSGDTFIMRARSSRTWNASRLPASVTGLNAVSDFDVIWEVEL